MGCPLRELSSSKSGARVLSGGIDDEEEDRSAALATVLPLMLRSVLVMMATTAPLPHRCRKLRLPL